MTVCTFDNPATLRRECWKDQKLYCSYDAALLPPFAKRPIPREHFFFGANIGPWLSGQKVGDPAAIKDSKP
jgi:hypothetical protein